MINKKMAELGNQPSVIRSIFEYSLKRKAEIGADNVYDFSLGNPSIPAPKMVDDTIKELVESGDSVALHGYTSAQGAMPVREQIAANIKSRFGFDAEAKNIYITCGAAASLTSTLKAVVNDGDEVILLAPFFPEYTVFAEKAGAKVKVVKNSEDFQIDFAALDKAITEKTKAVIVNSPNNPSGAVLSEETIVKLSSLLKEKSDEFGSDIYIIADEPYRELVYDGVEVPCLTRYYDDTIICYSCCYTSLF